MKVYKLPECVAVDSLPEGCVVALGNFDGVHLGHKALLETCVNLASASSCHSAVWTFSSLAKAGASAPHIATTDEKIRLIAECGIEYTVLEDFEKIRNTSPEDFANVYLADTLGISAAVCGFNFRFGKGGVGTAKLLSDTLLSKGKSVKIVDEVDALGAAVSSSRIREMIISGDVESAEKLMGHPFTVAFPVVHGKALGRKMGIPTVNQFFPKGHIVPAYGVYVCRVVADGKTFPAVANVGVRPTVEVTDGANCETHIMDFDGELYGENIRVELLKMLRPERKFSSVEELSAQIKRDVLSSREYFEKIGE